MPIFDAQVSRDVSESRLDPRYGGESQHAGRRSGTWIEPVVMEHNFVGTLNLLERCRETGAGFLLLSTSRVYSIPPLAGLGVEVVADDSR